MLINKYIRISLIFALMATLSPLTGCAVAAGTAATLMATKKLPTDFVAEGITGKDCNTLRANKDGGPICRSQNWGKYIETPKYCYKSLAGVDCYREKDPSRSDNDLVGQ